MPNQWEKRNYNPNLVWFNKTQKRFLCEHRIPNESASNCRKDVLYSAQSSWSFYSSSDIAEKQFIREPIDHPSNPSEPLQVVLARVPWFQSPDTTEESCPFIIAWSLVTFLTEITLLRWWKTAKRFTFTRVGCGESCGACTGKSFSFHNIADVINCRSFYISKWLGQIMREGNPAVHIKEQFAFHNIAQIILNQSDS